MYAIIETGGKQYKVAPGDILKVELLNAEDASIVKLDAVMINDNGNIKAGEAANGAYVNAEVIGSGRGKKIDIFTYKAKKNIRKRQGHRQPFTKIKITEIVG